MNTLVHPVIVKDRDDDLAKGSRTVPAFHSPYLRGIDVTEDGNWPHVGRHPGCRCVVKITLAGDVETVLKAEKPWTRQLRGAGRDVFVLGDTNPEKPTDWVPRIRESGAWSRSWNIQLVGRQRNP